MFPLLIMLAPIVMGSFIGTLILGVIVIIKKLGKSDTKSLVKILMILFATFVVTFIVQGVLIYNVVLK